MLTFLHDEQENKGNYVGAERTDRTESIGSNLYYFQAYGGESADHSLGRSRANEHGDRQKEVRRALGKGQEEKNI